MQSPAAAAGVSLRNILLPIDFSPCSETALAYAAGLARHYGTTLYTVTVVPEEITDYVQPPDPFYLRHSAEKKMAAVANLELLQGIRHREFVKEGFVPEMVSDLIDRLEIDLVVLGTHGRSGVKRFMLGSVAEEVLGSSPCPVLTLGPRVRRLTALQPKLQKILFATDLLHTSARALAYAEWLAEQEHAHLILLHVIKAHADARSGYPQSEVEAAKKRLAQLPSPETKETTASLDRECIVEVGLPGEQILNAAKNQGADLIVMGPHHTSFARVSTHLPWNTPHEVICHAQCPVLTVGV